MSTRDWLASKTLETIGASFVVIPIWAGIYGVVFRLLDNDPVPLMGFSALQKSYLSVVSVSLLASVPTSIFTLILRWMMPDILAEVVSWGVGLLVGAVVMLSVPAIVRYGLRPVDAILYSARRFGSRPFVYLGYYVATALLSLVGIFACGIGVLFTLGVWVVAPALLLLHPEPVSTPAEGDLDLSAD
jgi:hypothetical protein